MDHFFQVLVVHYCVLAEIQQETCTPDPEGAKIQKTVLGSQTRLDDHHGITYAYGTLLMEFYTIVMYVLYLGDMCWWRLLLNPVGRGCPPFLRRMGRCREGCIPCFSFVFVFLFVFFWGGGSLLALQDCVGRANAVARASVVVVRP